VVTLNFDLELKIGTAVIPALGNFYIDFGFLCLFVLDSGARKGQMKNIATCVMWPIRIVA